MDLYELAEKIFLHAHACSREDATRRGYVVRAIHDELQEAEARGLERAAKVAEEHIITRTDAETGNPAADIAACIRALLPEEAR